MKPEMRKMFLELALRRSKKQGHGSSVAFLRQRTAWLERPQLGPVLQNIAWVWAGDSAMRAYMVERVIQRAAVLLHERDAAYAEQCFEAVGYQMVPAKRRAFMAVQRAEEMAIDVYGWNDQWVDGVLQAPEYDAAGLAVLQLPYLIVMKLHDADLQDLADIGRMLSQASADECAEVEAVVAQLNPEYSQELSQLLIIAENERVGKQHRITYKPCSLNCELYAISFVLFYALCCLFYALCSL